MKIFYTGVQYNYYDPRRGSSFEHNNFYASLKRLSGIEVSYFPFERILQVGKLQFNQELLETVKREKPDLLFVFMVSDEFDPRVLDEIRRHTTSVAWFADDNWRFYNYSRIWAPLFTWAITTYSWMPELYRKIGQPNVIRSQWAADVHTYKPVSSVKIGKRPEVTFVGGWSNPRARLVKELEGAGITVSVYGSGWSGGRVSDEGMMNLFTQSKINLGLNPAPGYLNKNSLGRLLFRRSLDRIVPDFHIWRNFQSWLRRGIPQIKARHFEIPACGGFVITSPADDLERYYVPDKEIVLYRNVPELVEKIRYYLAHDKEREAIAEAGYQRTLRDHTYEKRFSEIFRRIGLH